MSIWAQFITGWVITWAVLMGAGEPFLAASQGGSLGGLAVVIAVSAVESFLARRVRRIRRIAMRRHGAKGPTGA